MSHDVEIDEARIEASFAAFENQGGQQALPPGQEYMGPEDEPAESPWLATCAFAFSWLNQYAPNWQVPEEKIIDLAEKGAKVLDQWFPSGPGDPEKLPPWAQFLACLGGIVIVYGFDFETFTVKPLKEPEPEDEREPEELKAENDTPHTTGGRFSTMGASEQ